jgi:hypothetical protein
MYGRMIESRRKNNTNKLKLSYTKKQSRGIINASI